MATSNPTTLTDFRGRWRFERRVRDFAGGPNGTMQGEAQFAFGGAGLVYRESGLLRLGELRPIRAERSYLWRQARPGAFEVLFADGRPFHSFDISGKPEAEHLCDPDKYRVTYDFAAWPEWQAVWRVSGPRKDYEMRTDYAPLALHTGMGDTDSKIDMNDGRGA